MRFLKNKIFLSKNPKITKKVYPSRVKLSSSSENSLSTDSKTNKTSTPKASPKGSNDSLFAKNIVKNYGKAMSAFAASNTALPYLNDFSKKNAVSIDQFLDFITTYKESVDSIDSLRTLLLIYPDDSFEMSSFKRIFKGLCEVFLKYFAVNWIFNGKMHHKLQHLKYRCKMLRRVRNPKMFTYLTSKIR